MPLSLKQIRAGAGSPGNGLDESDCPGASGSVFRQARTGLCSLPLYQATTGALQAAFDSSCLPGRAPNSYPSLLAAPPCALDKEVPCKGDRDSWNTKAFAVSSF